MIIEKELFIYLFDIMEYYKNSDFLLTKIFKILDNILRAKNDDIQEMVRYLIEDTPLIPFLINNAPKIIKVEESKDEAADQKSPKEEGEQNVEKSPE
jgi:hypothetical protein